MALDASSLRSQDFRRILLIKLSAVGDVVHTIPVLNKLRRRYPTARIDWLVTPAIAELIRHHPGISNLVLFDRQDWSVPWRPGWSALRRAASLIAELRAARYELIVDLHGQFRTAFFTLVAGAPVRVGFDRPRAAVWSASDRRFPEEARKHAAGGPGKSAKEGHLRPDKHNAPSQNQRGPRVTTKGPVNAVRGDKSGRPG